MSKLKSGSVLPPFEPIVAPRFGRFQAGFGGVVKLRRAGAICHTRATYPPQRQGRCQDVRLIAAFSVRPHGATTSEGLAPRVQEQHTDDRTQRQPR